MKRRKFIHRVSIGAISLAIPTSAYAIHTSERYMQILTSYTRNPSFSAVPGTEDYPGTPRDQKELYMNEEHVFLPKMGDLLKWQTSTNPYKAEKKDDKRRLQVILRQSLDEVPDNAVTWLGHASFLIHLDGIRLLIDPVLTSSILLKRHSALPFNTEVFHNIDYILISHNHRDHCDKESIQLLAKQNPEATWLCGLGLDTLLLNEWTGSKKIQAAGWYQQYPLNNPLLQIAFLPSRHWSRRGLGDTNASLWGAFMIQSKGKKIYFGGDSGYGSHVKKVGELFGVVDYYIAGIGAFAPRWFMSPSHMHPEEVARSSNELKPIHLIPMHYGTFDLSDEPLLEPARLIQQLKKENAFSATLLLPAVGEIISL
jgi:L-ascorbate metabolism protein UlaG (beta-lactamase superfamily)